MAKCGCAQGSCSCKFDDSGDVTWSGSGVKSDPFLATPKPLLIVDSTPTLALELDVGDDTMTLSAQPLIPVYVQEFTSDGTWTKPAGVTFARVMMIGGGGGGASGRSGGGTNSAGGGAGDAGQVVNFMLVGGAIPSSAAVTVGNGGLGGASVINGTGNAGGNGGSSGFDARLVRGGVGGQPLGLAGDHLAAGNPPGQFAVDALDIWIASHPYLAPGAGTPGGQPAWDAEYAGFSLPGQGSDWASGDYRMAAPGQDGYDELVTKMGGGGGGGDRGEAGGNGGLYGGGGGGGGYESSSSLPSGAGGSGAKGLVRVIAW